MLDQPVVADFEVETTSGSIYRGTLACWRGVDATVTDIVRRGFNTVDTETGVRIRIPAARIAAVIVTPIDERA